MQWTNDQKRVIELRNKNILVSAAAGSGKTAVLVERIITMITDSSLKVDIDKLLIVTFTNAAAAEMKERIEKAIHKKLTENPNDIHLQKQISLIHNAKITTIHSFCLNVIRNNFNLINLDPVFRVGQETELTLLKSDVMEALLERHYTLGNTEFYKFIESYASGKTDGKIEEMILQLYSFSQSYPWPIKWLEKQEENFIIDSVEQMESTEWMEFLLNYIKAVLKDIPKRLEEAIKICNLNNGPYMYIDALEDDMQLIRQIVEEDTYKGYANQFKSLKFKDLSRKRDETVSVELKEDVKRIRAEIKDLIKTILGAYFFQSPEEMLLDIKGSNEVMKVLLELTKEFSKDYKAAKAEKNIIDFNDFEHFALEILVKSEEGKDKPTYVAYDLSEYYKEILVDEYQDINYVQEAILNSISKEKYNKPNLFMVGDVKQSIYKFRLARPELFMNKYLNYLSKEQQEKQEQKEQQEQNIAFDPMFYEKIDLSKNFRSKEEVLLGINFIFNQIMAKSLGNIEYNHEVALNPGASYPKSEEDIDSDVELLLLDIDDEILNTIETDDEYREEDIEYTTIELEAKAVAKRIKELTDIEIGQKIWDGTNYRVAKYSDIVILLRTMSGWSEVFVNILMDEGILAHADSTTGYFKTIEVKTVINLLKIIDNPRQDIPLTAILKSPIGNFNTTELAKIRGKLRQDKIMSMADHKQFIWGEDIYSSIGYYIEHGIEEDLKEKLINFIKRINIYREWVPYTSIHNLILKLLENTGYEYYLSVMPKGEKRRANVDMLVQKALQFEKTSYTGLFNFIRYIDNLEKYEVDFGEASVLGEKDNTVRIMSIHKSKGLEFPIVFVSGIGKQFNKNDLKSKIIIHPDMGIGPDYIDYKLRIKSPTLIKKAIQKKVQLENLGEELRVLYVALTRAKEKLIITGAIKSLVSKLEKWSTIINHQDEKLLFNILSGANQYAEWIIPALIRHPSSKELMEQIGINYIDNNYLQTVGVNFSINLISIQELVKDEIKKQVMEDIHLEEFMSYKEDKIYDTQFKDQIEERMSFKYPYEFETKLKSKMSITELKRITNGIEEQEDNNAQSLFEDEELIPIVPDFMSMDKKNISVIRGSIYHKILESLDFEKTYTKDNLKELIHRLIENRIITKEEAVLIKDSIILSFLDSDTVKRMKVAQIKGKLFKEKQFVLGINPEYTGTEQVSKEIVLIQGIIDAYFEEEGEYVIVDYKTDFIKKGDEQVIIDRYKSQLEYYKMALEQIESKKVKEKIIFSLALNKEIVV